MKKLQTIKVIYEDGDSTVTRINAEKEEIETYYLGKTFNVGTEKDELKKCVAIEYLED